jgi:ABC-type transport system substrate-binding protein
MKKQKSSLSVRLVSLLSIALTVALTATSVPAAEPKPGGTLKVGIPIFMQPEDLDPHTYFSSWNDPYLRAIFDTLVAYDDQTAYREEISLAESWQSVDDVTLVFKLRKGVKFTDGTVWNAEVLKFSLDRIGDPETKSPRAYVVKNFKNVEYLDQDTVKIVLKEPMASIFGELSHAGMSMSSPAHVGKSDPKELKRQPIGTGPFVFSESKADSHYLLAKNPNYWMKDADGRQLPYLDMLRLVVIPDENVRLANLRTGQVDVNASMGHKDVARIKADPNLKVIIQHGQGLRGMYWNLSRPPANNLNFRRAFMHAINRKAMAKVITFGISPPAVGVLSPRVGWAFDLNLPVPQYDPEKAKAYLAKAIAEGVKPEYTTSAQKGEFMQQTEMMQADLAKVGIKLNILPEEIATSAHRMWSSKESDSFYAGYSFTADPYSKMYVGHHSKGYYTPEPDGWDTPEGYFAKLDPLIEASNKTYDLKERAKYLNQATLLIAEHVGFVCNYYTSNVASVHKDVEGFSLGGDGHARYVRAWLNR